MASIIDTIFGTDLIYDNTQGLRVAPNGDYTEINGQTNLKNWIYHCLITEKGSFRWRPNYGCGVLTYVKRKATSANLSTLKADIITNLTQDQRISAVDVKMTSQMVNGQSVLMIYITPTINGNPIILPAFSFAA